jgi:hypothetical protein
MALTLIKTRFKTKVQGLLRIKSVDPLLQTYIKNVKELDHKALLTMAV